MVQEGDKLLATVRRKFRLKHLTHSNDVSTAQFYDALRRLQQVGSLQGAETATASSLLSFLPNVSIRIVADRQFSVAVDGFLCVPFDFAVLDDEDK